MSRRTIKVTLRLQIRLLGFRLVAGKLEFRRKLNGAKVDLWKEPKEAAEAAKPFAKRHAMRYFEPWHSFTSGLQRTLVLRAVPAKEVSARLRSQ